jgi:hypothetical protein
MRVRRPWSVITAVVLFAACWWPAGPAGAQAPVLGGNGFPHFFSMQGYLDGISGGCFHPDPSNAGLTPGKKNTGIIIGTMSLRGGVLSATAGLEGFDSPKYTGTLHDDGTFLVRGRDLIRTALTDTISGKISTLSATGQRSVKLVSGNWTTWHVDGKGTCMMQWTMTGGSVDFTCQGQVPGCGLGAPGFGQQWPLTVKAVAAAGTASRQVTVSLSSKISNRTTKWSLAFGDGAVAAGVGLPASRSHTYAKAGTYTITVRLLSAPGGTTVAPAASTQVTVAQ